MSTSSKNALRGKTAAEPSEHEEPMNLSEFDEAEVLDHRAQELEDDPEDDPEGLDSLDTAPLPDFTEVDEATGAWVYTLQHPLSDGASDLKRIRIPKEIYAKDVRNSSRGKTQAETLFYMLASCAGIPPRVLDKLNAIDYMVASALMNRRALGNSRAVLSAMSGKGR